jgi:RHS repeat-associated protein
VTNCTNNLRKSITFFRFILWLVIALIVVSAPAQTSVTDGSTPLALSPGAPAGSYALSGFENVNLYNGNLNFHLPLLGVGGRGSAGYAMTLALDLKSWRVNHTEKVMPNGDELQFYSPTQKDWVGTSPGYGAGLLVGRGTGIGTEGGQQACVRHYKYALTRMTFKTADGTEYELRDVQTGGQPLRGIGPCASGGGASRGTTFISSDGTAVTFISDTAIVDNITIASVARLFYPSGYLMLRDGTRYRIDNGTVTWLRDRNGNKVSFAYAGDSMIVTDPLNRKVTVNYNVNDVAPYGLCDQVIFKGSGGAERVIRVSKTTLANALRPNSGFSIQTMHDLFPELNNSSSTTVHNPPVISKVWLPNSDGSAQPHQYYQFFYNSYGELARVELPTGGAIEYDSAPGSGVMGACQYCDEPQINRRVKERRVYPNGSSGVTFESKVVYDVVSASGAFDQRPWSTTVTSETSNQAGTVMARSRHFFGGSGVASLFQVAAGYVYSDWNEGREKKTELLDTAGPLSSATVLRRSETTFQQRAPVSWWSSWAAQEALDPGSEPANDPRVSMTTTTIEPGGPNLISKRIFGYDDSVPFNNQNNLKEYDFGPGAPGSLLRETRTTYLTATNYTGANAHLRSLPLQVSLFDALGTERSRASYEYDNYSNDSTHSFLVGRASISGFDLSFNPSYTTRGNMTATTKHLLNGSGSVIGYISTFAQYDVAGNTVKTIDARGYASLFDFADRFGAPDGEARANAGPVELSVSGQSSYAFSSLITNALGHTSYLQFDYYLGCPVDAEDANGTVFSGYYGDLLDRPTKLVKASNREISFQSETVFNYNDSSRIVSISNDLHSFTDHILKNERLYDGLGRTTETRQYEGGSNYIAMRSSYDGMGRPAHTSNPFRPWKNESPVWNLTAFDALGRVTSLTTVDGATARTAYQGNEVTTTDQIGKQRKSVSDALDRVVRVYEDPNGVNWLTGYEYDVLGDLTRVVQEGQTRTFTFDSVARMTSATHPESGASTFTYDNNGNLQTRADARGVITSIVYDPLNRPVSRTYQNDSSGTPVVNYFYDGQALPAGAPASFPRGFSTGRLVAVTYGNNSSTGDYYGYDVLGRIGLKIQRTGSVNYQTSSGFNVSGRTISLTYPSGHSVSYNYDQAGRLGDRDAQNMAMTGDLGDGMMRSYASELSYSNRNALAQEKFGTDTPIFNKRFYNSRGQLSEIRESTSANNTNWNRGAIINHYSDQCWGVCAGSSMTDNNSNLKRQDIYVPNDDQISSFATWADAFSYDNLNRLQRVREFTNNSANDWQQEYVYDRWGNRTVQQTNTWGTGIPKPNFAVNSANNRLTAPSGSPLNYDAAGNLTNDTYTGEGQRIYDGEGRMTQAWANNQWQTYVYDGNGGRVRRTVNGQETWQVYGLGNELIAEYAANSAASTPQREYGYRNDQLLITATGSSRTNVALAANGAVATASSAQDAGRDAPAAINGDRKGIHWGTDAATGSGWNNGTTALPAWLQVDFNGSKTIGQIDLFAPQDNYTNPVEPTTLMTFTLYGLSGFELQYWNGSSWVTIPGCSVTGNNKIWRQFSFAPIATSKIRVLTNASPDSYSRLTEIEAWTSSATSAPQRINMALAANGSVATASSAQDAGRDAPATINGDRKGIHWGTDAATGSGWNNGTTALPAWLQVDFNGSKTIDEIDLFAPQDNYTNPVEPTMSMTFTLYGLSGFELQYWSGSGWVTIPNCSVSGNNKIWRQFTFAAIATSKIRVLTNASPDSYSRLTEIEAWGASGSSATPASDIKWLVSDQLGTPRMIFDKTGSLANTKRHDYLPFGEELPAAAGMRSGVTGYGLTDGIRQKFTEKERDSETGLDYFLARYHSSAHGRFTSPDPLLGSGSVTDPQTWNRYSYALNNPLRFVDPSGLAAEPDPGTGEPQAPATAQTIKAPQEVTAAIMNGLTQVTVDVNGKSYSGVMQLDQKVSDQVIGLINENFGRGVESGTLAAASNGIAVPATIGTQAGISVSSVAKASKDGVSGDLGTSGSKVAQKTYEVAAGRAVSADINNRATNGQAVSRIASALEGTQVTVNTLAGSIQTTVSREVWRQGLVGVGNKAYGAGIEDGMKNVSPPQISPAKKPF